MNKFFTKIASLSVGLALAIGVGVAIGNNTSKAARADNTYTIGWGTASGTAGTYTNFKAVSGTVTGILSFTTAKEKSGSNPAYNSSSNELRLYYNSGGNGGSITLTPASGITITGAVVTTSTSPSVNYFVDGGNSVAVSASNNTYTISGISAKSSLKLQNANTTNTQFRIKTIAITYVTGEINYTVEYNGNGNTSGSAPTDDNKYTSETIKEVDLLGSNTLEKTGYHCDGWSLSSDGDVAYSLNQENQDLSEHINSNNKVILYAHWTLNTYNVTLNANFGVAPETTVLENQLSGFAAPDCDFTNPDESVKFDNWNTAADGTGTEYEVSDPVTVTDNTLVLYAQWEEISWLTYVANNGTQEEDVEFYVFKCYTYKVDDPLSEEVGFTPKSGCTFKEWNTAADGSGTSYVVDGSTYYSFENDTKLYAIWVKEGQKTTFDCTIDLDLNNTSQGPGSITKSNITFSCDDGILGNNAGYRLYKNSDTEISVTNGNIVKILFNCQSSYPASGFDEQTGWSLIENTDNGVWTGKSQSVTFTAGTKQVRATSIEVTLEYVPQIQIDGTLTAKAGSTSTLTAKDPDTLASLSGVAWTSSDTDVATVSNGVVNAKSQGTATITASKTGYLQREVTFTVDYSDVTKISIKKDDVVVTGTSIGFYNESVDLDNLTVEILPATALQDYTWELVSAKKTVEAEEVDMVVGTDYDYNASTKVLSSYETEGTIVFQAKSTADEAKTAPYTVVIVGNPVVSVSSTLSGYSGKSTNLAYSFDNFSEQLSVISSDTDKVTVGTPTVSTGSSGSGTVQVNFDSATESNTPVDVYFKHGEDIVATCQVTVIASKIEYIFWGSSEDFAVYAGSTALNSEKILSWIPKYHMNNDDEDLISSDFSISLNGSAYTLGTPLEVGVYTVELTYMNKTTESNPTLTVVQRLNAIDIDESDTYSYTFEAKTFDSYNTALDLGGVSWTASATGGDYFGYDSTKGQQFGSGKAAASSLHLSASFDGTIKSIKVNTSGASSVAASVSVSVGDNSYICDDKTSASITSSAADYTFTGSSQGTIDISWTQTSSKALYIKSIEVNYGGVVSYANNDDHVLAQAAVVKFAKSFNSAMDNTNHCTENLKTIWEKTTEGGVMYAWNQFVSELNNLDVTEQDWAYAMLKKVTGKYTEDTDANYLYCLERAMRTYDICVSSKYKMTNFMKDREEETIRTAYMHQNNLLSIFKQDSVGTIIVIISSIVAIASFAGYFYYKKKKED